MLRDARMAGLVKQHRGVNRPGESLLWAVHVIDPNIIELDAACVESNGLEELKTAIQSRHSSRQFRVVTTRTGRSPMTCSKTVCLREPYAGASLSARPINWTTSGEPANFE